MALRKCVGTVFWKGKTVVHSVSVRDDIEIHLPRKAYCNLCTDMASYSSSGKKGFLGLCSIQPPTHNTGVLSCTAARTVFSIFYHGPGLPTATVLP